MCIRDSSNLDVRLTFRTTTSSGLVEICNELGNWSIVCSNKIREVEPIVICKQLGFSTQLTNYFTESVPLTLSNHRSRLNEVPKCNGSESSLHECQSSDQFRARRGLVSEGSNTCDSQVGLQCGGIYLRDLLQQYVHYCSACCSSTSVPPQIYFNPPSSSRVYVVEQQRSLKLSCSWNQNIYPPVASFTNSTGEILYTV